MAWIWVVSKALPWVEFSALIWSTLMPAMAAMRLADKPDDVAPYFSIVLVPGWKGRS